MSYIGTTEIGKIFLGTVEIEKAYLGDDLVFSSASGPAPVEPVFYDYLYFDGTAYVNTDYYLPELCSIRVILGYETQKVAQRVFRANGNGLTAFIYGSATNTTNRRINIYYDSTSASASNRNLAFSTSAYHFFMTPNRYGWGSTTSYTISKGSEHPTGVLQIGGYGTGQPFTGRMETFYIYGSDAQNATTAVNLRDNYTPIAKFRPCTYNGEAGFWYVEGNKFFGNSAGSGALTASNS